MKQLVLEQPGRWRMREVPPPEPAAGAALVRVHRVGICGTDLHAFAGHQPFFNFPRILGHEFSVEIVECPPNDRGLAPGDRCAVEPYRSCGQCRACRRGKTNCCEKLEVLGVHTDGGMQEWMALPLASLHKSNTLNWDRLALVEPLGVGAHAVARSGLSRGETALVVGAGPIGMAVALSARLAGAEVELLDVNPARRALAAQFGFATLEKAPSTLADVVFDATGNAGAMAQSLLRVAHGGRLVFVGLTQDSVALDDSLFHRREVTLLASRNSVHQFPRLIDLMEQGALDVSAWITHRIPLAEVPEQFARLASDAKCFKAVVEVSNAQF